MYSKSFTNLSRNECVEQSGILYQNSKAKWESAIAISENGTDYGAAISLAIISIEELVKALILYLDGVGFEFRKIKGVSAILNKNHEVRYFIAWGIFAGSFLVEETLRIYNKANSDNKFAEMLRNLNGDSSFINVKYFAFRRLVLLRNHFNYFEKLDVIRQDGFYTDYRNQLKSPLFLTLEDYKSATQGLGKLYLIGISTFESFAHNKNQPQTDLEQRIIKKIKEEHWYEKIEIALSVIRRNKKSPFEALREYLYTNVIQ